MTDFTPAKRGDFAVTLQVKRGYSLYAGNYSHVKVTVSRVTSITRDGLVKKALPLSGTAAHLTKRDWDKIVILTPSKLADVEGFIAECTARQTPNPGTFAPFKSFEDVRETARKYI